MQNPSGMLKAGQILLLVGSILQAVGAGFLLIFAIFFSAILGAAADPSGADPRLTGVILASVYGIMGVLAGIGCIFGFLAHGRAKAGNLGGAFAFGLTASLLPPLQIVLLLGAIFCKVSPEASAGQAPYAAPPR